MKNEVRAARLDMLFDLYPPENMEELQRSQNLARYAMVGHRAEEGIYRVWLYASLAEAGERGATLQGWTPWLLVDLDTCDQWDPSFTWEPRDSTLLQEAEGL